MMILHVLATFLVVCFIILEWGETLSGPFDWPDLVKVSSLYFGCWVHSRSGVDGMSDNKESPNMMIQRDFKESQRRENYRRAEAFLVWKFGILLCMK